jgi:hypothetical protein
MCPGFAYSPVAGRDDQHTKDRPRSPKPEPAPAPGAPQKACHLLPACLGKQRVEQFLPDAEVRGDEARKRSRQVEQSAAGAALEQTERADGVESTRPGRGNTGAVVHQYRVRADGSGECNGGPFTGIETGNPRIGVRGD